MKEQIEQIIELCRSKCLDKNKYIQVLDSMELPTPVLDKEDIRVQLQQQLDYDRLLAEQNDYLSRLFLGERWLYWNLWQRIRELGIGHLSSFYMIGSSFFVEIHLSLGIYKKNDETKEEFKERQKQFLDKTKYQYQSSKNTGSVKIVACDNNLDILKKELSNFIKFDRYDVSSRNGCFNIISFYASEIIPFVEELEKKEFGLASIEQIEKDFMGILDAMATSEVIPSLKETFNAILNSAYYSVCGILGHSNSYTKKYEEIVLSEKERNKETKKMADKVGESVSQDEMKDVYKNVQKAFVRYMAKKYCLHVSVRWDQGLKFTGTFNRDCCMLEFDYEEEINGVFDSIANISDWEYDIPCEKVDFVQKILKWDGIDEISFNISNGKINEISGTVRNMKNLKRMVEGADTL